MASTPSPRAPRARTPGTPVHGAAFDSYEPYSPRRSKRNTAQSNPYSSFNSERDNVTPPTTVKTARFARNPTHLSSPPSSPISPVRHRVHKTPRKPHFRSSQSAGHSDSDQAATSLAPPTTSAAMLPTPLKTPKKRNNAAISSTARILNFQPHDPNDVMPGPRKLKGHSRMRSTSGFELYDDELLNNSQSIPVFTDTNARVPEMDDADDNPFVGPKTTTRATRSSGRNSEAHRVDNMIRKDEGVVYVFRGKKVFRRFEDVDRDGSPSSSDSFGSVTNQRQLKRQIGAAAQRPLTRSTVKPQLLFPTEEQLREREKRANEIDEEAVTDIEMSNTSPIKKDPTPRRKKRAPATPPTTMRTTRFADKMGSPTGPSNNTFEPETNAITPTASKPPRNKTQSPFDAWPRTKAGRKRAGGVVEGNNAGKRTRSSVVRSPA